jgi:hypothetical protein
MMGFGRVAVECRLLPGDGLNPDPPGLLSRQLQKNSWTQVAIPRVLNAVCVVR